MKYAIKTSYDNKPFDWYPDWPYDSKEEALKKVEYLNTYAKEHALIAQNKVVKITQKEVEEIETQMKEWIACID